MRAYVSAIRHIPRCGLNEKKIKKIAKAGRKEFTMWFRHFGIGVKGTILKRIDWYDSEQKKRVAWLYSHLLFWTGGTRFILEVTRRLQKNWDITVIVEKASAEIKRSSINTG